MAGHACQKRKKMGAVEILCQIPSVVEYLLAETTKCTS